MSTIEEEVIIRIVFTSEDVATLALDLMIDDELALERAKDWAKAIQETAVSLINEQLEHVIEYNSP